jgi:hypothetical protein
MERKKTQILFFCLVLCLVIKGYSQQSITVKGVVVDTANVPVIGAIIKISTATDSIKRSSNMDGMYSIPNIRYPRFAITVSYIGYQTVSKSFGEMDLSGKSVISDTIVLKESSNSLDEIKITGIVPVRVKEDTIEYSAAAYPVRDGDAVEEVIKKLPGVVVDKDGNVTANGKPVTKIRVNGKDFFGSDVATAIQSLPADIVKNLQIVDDYGEQARLTGIKAGEPEKILNINIDPEKKVGYSARGMGGLGNEDRFLTNLRGNFMKGERMITFDGSVNNTNIRGGNGNGITDTRTLSVSYRKEMSKKVSVDGGFNMNSRNNNTTSTILRQNIYETFTRYDDQSAVNKTGSAGGSAWGNFEYRPDTINFIKFSPNFSLSTSDLDAVSKTNTLIKKARSFRDNLTGNENAVKNGGLNIFYNHKFKKYRRNISLTLSSSFSGNENDREARNNYENTDSLNNTTFVKQNQLTGTNNTSTRYGTNMTFSEPLGRATFADITYNWNYSDTRSLKDVRDVNAVTGAEVFNSNLSNRYNYQFITNRVGMSLRHINEKYNLNVGISMQPALLKGHDLTRGTITNKETFVIIPNARYVYRFSRQSALTLNYSGRSNQPSFNQLQPITDNSNLQNTISGNPDLKPEYIHGINADFAQSDWTEGYNLFANISYSRTQNKIVTTKIVVPETIHQLTSYINTGGFYNMNGNYSFAKPFDERKYIITYSGQSRYSNNVAFTDMKRNLAKNLVITQGLRFQVNVKDLIDAEINTSYSVNTTKYSLASLSDRKTNTLTVNINGRNYFFEDLSLGYDASQVINSGYSYSSNTNPTLVSVFIEYRFLKGNTANIRVQGFDLMNQNTGISRDVFDNEIVDRQTNRLARYFLMSFSYRIRKYGGKS